MIHVHEPDSTQVLSYKCDQVLANFSNAYSSGNYRISDLDTELTQLDALVVEYSIVEDAMLHLHDRNDSASATSHLGPDRGVRGTNTGEAVPLRGRLNQRS